jgi:hypothetical protein
MPGYIIQWYDETGKVYREVSTSEPLPVTTVGSGSGGAEKVEITSTGGDTTTGAYGTEAATNVGLDTNARVMGQNGTNAIPVTAANTSVDGVDPNAVGLAANSRLFGFNGTGWDRLRVDGSKNLIVSTGASYIPANTGAYSPDSSNALQSASLLFGYDTTQNQYISIHALNNALFVSVNAVPVVGAHANAWNAAAVLAAGTSTSIDCQYEDSVSAFGNTSAATDIEVEVSQDNTNFYKTGIKATGANGDFYLSIPDLGARYVRLSSSAAATITATIAGKG